MKLAEKYNKGEVAKLEQRINF